jgi:hypothetical protein
VSRWQKGPGRRTRKACQDETRVQITARDHVHSLAPVDRIEKD